MLDVCSVDLIGLAKPWLQLVEYSLVRTLSMATSVMHCDCHQCKAACSSWLLIWCWLSSMTVLTLVLTTCIRFAGPYPANGTQSPYMVIGRTVFRPRNACVATRSVWAVPTCMHYCTCASSSPHARPMLHAHCCVLATHTTYPTAMHVSAHTACSMFSSQLQFSEGRTAWFVGCRSDTAGYWDWATPDDTGECVTPDDPSCGLDRFWGGYPIQYAGPCSLFS